MKQLLIYPGRFQPPHPGHSMACRWLREQFPNADAFIATSDHRDPGRSPLSFKEKRRIFEFMGIGGVRHAREPYRAREICEGYDPQRTLLTYSVCRKDMEGREARFGSIGLKKDGTPSYFQPWPGPHGEFRPASEHAYIVPTPVFKFTLEIKGRRTEMTGASQFREMFPDLDDEGRADAAKSLYGEFDQGIFDLLCAKFL